MTDGSSGGSAKDVASGASGGVGLGATLSGAQFEPTSVQDAFASIKLMCEKAPSDLPPGWQSATDPER